MLGQIPRRFAPIALVATFLTSGVGVTANARADDCISAPNSPAPRGSHWYYRLDWATQRKCWYVRAPGQASQQVAAVTTIGPAETPTPSGAPSLRVKIPVSQPIFAPVPGGTTDKTSQQSTHEENAVSTPEVPAPQRSTLSETSPQGAAPPAVTWPDPAVAVAAVKAQGPIAVPTDVRAASVSDDAEKTTRRAEPTNNAAMPMIFFPVLALGLAGVVLLSSVVIKKRRARIIIDHPEPERVDDERQHEWTDGPYQYESVVEGKGLHFLTSAVSDPDPLRDDDGAFQITKDISERSDKLLQLRRDIDQMLQSAASPYEEPLRGRVAV